MIRRAGHTKVAEDMQGNVRVRSLENRDDFEVRVHHVPRFKDSPNSGSEWRTHVSADVLFKGEVVAITDAGSVRSALLKAALLLDEGWELNDEKIALLRKKKCCQTGCNADATVFYRRKADYCRACSVPNRNYPQPTWAPMGKLEHDYRIFCAEHAYRGIGYYDDSDDNYERVDENGALLADPPAVNAPDPAENPGGSRILSTAQAFIARVITADDLFEQITANKVD